ncbi:MAG TPA: hypothetical protein VJ691_13820 [Vicinamibacterales bacterium]|nr:hypothetical protein [Vicinamibacterales bacterium]
MSLKPEAATSLKFDTATPTKTDAATPAEGVTCAVCQRTIADKYFDVNGQPACDRCRLQVARQAETPQGFAVFGRATLYGLGAAILGAIVYYAVIAITNFEIGLVAIAIGFMVGYAVRTATDNRGGRRFQILAIVLTYWAVGLAYTPFLFQAGAESQEMVIAPTTDTATSEPASAEPASTEPAAAEDKGLDSAGLVVAFGIVFGLTFALPVLTIFASLPGGLISAAIIAFGMQQAWQMTRAPQVVITGPYRIASKLAS